LYSFLGSGIACPRFPFFAQTLTLASSSFHERGAHPAVPDRTNLLFPCRFFNLAFGWICFVRCLRWPPSQKTRCLFCGPLILSSGSVGLIFLSSVPFVTLFPRSFDAFCWRRHTQLLSTFFLRFVCPFVWRWASYTNLGIRLEVARFPTLSFFSLSRSLLLGVDLHIDPFVAPIFRQITSLGSIPVYKFDHSWFRRQAVGPSSCTSDPLFLPNFLPTRLLATFIFLSLIQYAPKSRAFLLTQPFSGPP